MKFGKVYLLFALVGSLSLAGCGDSGFSVIHSTNNNNNNETTRGDEKQDTDNPSANSGGSNSGADDQEHEHQEPVTPPNQEVDDTPQEGGISVIDMTDRISMFSFNFVEVSDNDYIRVTFDNDPLDEKYEFSYYTVNGKEVTNQHLEKVPEENQTYEINLDATATGKYTVEFYNKQNKQYGVAYISVNNQVVSTTYVAMMFGVAQVQLAAIGYNIMVSMKKIGDFFTWLFTGDTSSGMTFGE